MRTHRLAGRVTLGTLLMTMAPAVGGAEVTRVEIQRREDVLGGKSFGAVGPYEKIVGKVYFAIDPANPHNTTVADLDKAPKNAQRRVEFTSDLYIIKPKDLTRGNGVTLFDIVNRGNKQLLATFSRGGRAPDPTTEADFGDAYLLNQGYTMVAVGWQFDVPKGRGLVGFDPPVATDNGKPITGWVKMWFISDKPIQSFAYVGGFNTPAYAPLDLNDRRYRLTEREGIAAPSRLIPRDDWEFARLADGKVVSDPKSIYLKSSFRPGLTYEVAFEAKDPPVAGLGLAAIRDTASALRYEANSIAPSRYTYMYGASQTGRLIRQIVRDGFMIDERGRKVFDAAFVQTGATGVGSFNERFAQPNELGSFTQTKFPILYRTTTDPITGREDGLGARIPTGLEPKLMLVDTASEYWDRGRVAALRHTSLDGRDDLADAPNVRVYTLAGAKHGPGTFPPVDGGGQFKENTNDYRWAQRGLLAALDAWVRQGKEPPPSRHPKLADGTLVAQGQLKFPAVPAVQWPTSVPGGYRADVPAPYSFLPFLVPRVDADGNDMGGIRLPQQAVPLAAFTGWQFRSERIGAPDLLVAMAGAYIPLPKTKADAARLGDPRVPIVERYLNRTSYLQKVRNSADRLAQERYILRDDIEAIVREAGQHWDYVMGEEKKP